MRQAHLKKPAIMTVWEALIRADIVTDNGSYPVTPDEVAKAFAYNYK